MVNGLDLTAIQRLTPRPTSPELSSPLSVPFLAYSPWAIYQFLANTARHSKARQEIETLSNSFID